MNFEAEPSELDKRLEFFFFDSSKPREKYSQRFNELYPKEIKAYSPLYLIRRDIYLLRNLFEFKKIAEEFSIDHRGDFTALLLADLLIEGLVSNLLASKKEGKYI
jgi:hypothetical protein